jgi:FkbM family methyltransferase
MLINYSKVCEILRRYGIKVKGILHVGAHECEELNDYMREGISPQNIVWIEGNEEKVHEMKLRGIPNIYQGLVSDKEEEVNFYITNNGQSSSILELETHKVHHPHVFVSTIKKQRTSTIENIFRQNGLDGSKYNFWNFDIQGAELLALKGAGDLLKNADVLYMEVNEEELYKGCALIGELDEFLKGHGFRRVETSITDFKWGDALYIHN